jgi:3-oxoacyl-[acyl-carrier-protein] synthase III
VQVIPNLLDNKEVFLHACATVAFALRAVADAVRTRTEKLPYYRVHSVYERVIAQVITRPAPSRSKVGDAGQR